MERDEGTKSDVRARALRALRDALTLTCPGIVLDEQGYTASFAENVVSSVRVTDFEADLTQGSGDEFGGKFRAAHSSSALAVNCFAPFKRNLSDLRVCGVDGFTSLHFEKKCPTGLRGTPPNLDVLLERTDRVIAIESKCTEYLSPHAARFSSAYLTGIRDSRRESVWYRELLRLVDAPQAFRWLDAAQLLKHALGLMHCYRDRPVTLLYLYWEPLNAADYPLLGDHRRDTAEFGERVAGAQLDFDAMSYNELWSTWDEATPRWLSAHLGDLRPRYSVEI